MVTPTNDYTATKVHLLKSGMIYDKITIMLLVLLVMIGVLVILIKCST